MRYPEKYRITDPLLSMAPIQDIHCFNIPFRGYMLTVIASDDNGWGHLSVSLKNRNPNWDEMCYVKNLFFEDEVCIQFHPKKSEYVNLFEHCLHIWRPPSAIVKALEDKKL